MSLGAKSALVRAPGCPQMWFYKEIHQNPEHWDLPSSFIGTSWRLDDWNHSSWRRNFKELCVEWHSLYLKSPNLKLRNGRSPMISLPRKYSHRWEANLFSVEEWAPDSTLHTTPQVMDIVPQLYSTPPHVFSILLYNHVLLTIYMKKRQFQG